MAFRTPPPKSTSNEHVTRRMIRRPMELLGVQKPRSFNVLATRPESMYIPGAWSFTAHDDHLIDTRPLKPLDNQCERSSSCILKMLKASFRKVLRRKDSSMQLHDEEEEEIDDETNDSSCTTTIKSSDHNIPALSRVNAHQVSYVAPQVRATNEHDKIMTGLRHIGSTAQHDDAVQRNPGKALPITAGETPSTSSSGLEHHEGIDDQRIPRELHGITHSASQHTTTTAVSTTTSSNDTMTHHDSSPESQVVRVADVHCVHRPRIINGPARPTVLHLSPSISSSSGERPGSWGYFYNNVMVARTLSQCIRATGPLSRQVSQRPRICTAMDRPETREADMRPLLRRNGTDGSCVSYGCLAGPSRLVVTNP